MKTRLIPTFAIASATLLALGATALQAEHHGLPKADKDGWITLFNGKDLTGWDGNPEVWSVKDGYISGSIDKLVGGNTFLVYKHEFSDFELEADFVLVDGKGNSGIQYRSKQSVRGANKWVVTGYQADIGNGWFGKLYEEGGRGVLAGKYVNAPEIKGDNAWNTFRVTADGKRLKQEINGAVTIEFEDKDEKKSAKSGVIALQYHSPGAFEVRFKNIRIKPGGKELVATNEKCPVCGEAADPACVAEYEGVTYAFHSGGCRDKWTKERQGSLYHRLGGKAAMDAAVEKFYVKVLADEHINGFFEDVDMKRQARKQKEFLSAAFGGPTPWKGKDMRTAHQVLDLEESHFNAVAGHLQATLEELKVPEELIKEVMAIAGSVKGAVLNEKKE